MIRATFTACLTLVLSASAQSLPDLFRAMVSARLELPAEEQREYAKLLRATGTAPHELVLLVDRSPQVQAAIVFAGAGENEFHFIGASPVSTGRPGGFEHFLTPLGIFEHSLAHPDYRAEGTKNRLGIRGYGRKGMRVFDFGWQKERQTWGQKLEGQMRLQMHATDPDRLEKKLGTRQSKGCIRIHSSFNQFLDEYGVLDAAYTTGESFLLTRPQKRALPEPYRPGRFLVVVETERTARPAWSPAP